MSAKRMMSKIAVGWLDPHVCTQTVGTYIGQVKNPVVLGIGYIRSNLDISNK